EPDHRHSLRRHILSSHFTPLSVSFICEQLCPKGCQANIAFSVEVVILPAMKNARTRQVIRCD
ncbi:hypothetical protein KJJ97_26875, partial [Escherichia coli]|uniref:hypothetical protein n=1 Tax=Escherichia coli TaxID=562 RepID=UPI001BD96900